MTAARERWLLSVWPGGGAPVLLVSAPAPADGKAWALKTSECAIVGACPQASSGARSDLEEVFC